MNKLLKKGLEYFTIAILVSGINLCVVKKQPDFTIKKPGLKVDVTFPKKELIKNYGKNDLNKLLEVEINNLYDEIQNPELKEFYLQTRILYLETLVDILEQYKTMLDSTSKSKNKGDYPINI